MHTLSCWPGQMIEKNLRVILFSIALNKPRCICLLLLIYIKAVNNLPHVDTMCYCLYILGVIICLISYHNITTYGRDLLLIFSLVEPLDAHCSCLGHRRPPERGGVLVPACPCSVCCPANDELQSRNECLTLASLLAQKPLGAAIDHQHAGHLSNTIYYHDEGNLAGYISGSLHDTHLGLRLGQSGVRTHQGRVRIHQGGVRTNAHGRRGTSSDGGPG